MFIQTFKNLLISFFLFGLYFISFSQVKDTSKVSVVKEIKIIGNKTTRDNIIVREIPFVIGDTISKENLHKVLERTQSNLLNTSLFNFVTVEPVNFDNTHISIYITVEERWYWWPIPIFDIEETNFNTWWLDKDYNKVNYGLFLAKENFRGRKETIMFKVQGGYTEQLGIKYIIPYINKNKTNGLSAKFSYSRNHEVTYSTTNNIRDYYRSGTDYIKKEISANIGYEIRPKLYNKHIFYLEYRNIGVADSVVLLNKNFLTEDNNSMQFLSLNYTFKRDKRNNKSYPTKGHYYDIFLVKNGLGMVDEKLNSFYFTTQLRRFWELSNRVYFSGSIKSKFTIKDSPYYFYNARGYHNDFIRGYELYVINGEHFSIVKTQLRYALLKSKIFKINSIPAEKFNKIPLAIYLGAFFDAGYVDSKIINKNNFLVNSTLYGGGFGVDFVSYYDIVFRAEYSINKLNEHGLFLHFIAPI
jgi:outer membrane protein assembly factor BamA